MAKGVRVFDGDGDYTENVKKLMEEIDRLKVEICGLEKENDDLKRALSEERKRARQRGDTLWRIARDANATLAEEIPEEEASVPIPYHDPGPAPCGGRTAAEVFNDLMSRP